MARAIFDGQILAESDDDIAQNAAFAYEQPWPLTKRLVTDRIAFWQGVQVRSD